MTTIEIAVVILFVFCFAVLTLTVRHFTEKALTKDDLKPLKKALLELEAVLRQK